MNERRFGEMLNGLDPEEASIVREFAHRDLWEQNVYLFREIRDVKRELPDLVDLPCASPPVALIETKATLDAAGFNFGEDPHGGGDGLVGD